MSEDGTYNGWKNYETWAVGMFLDGNYTGEGTYREVLDIVDDHRQSMRADEVLVVVAEALKDYVEQEVLGDASASLATDLLGAAVSEVDWRELAEGKLSELAEA